MRPLRTDEYYEERIARYLELAEAAQEAAGRAVGPSLQETYAQLACQWVRLAELAGHTIELSRKVSPLRVGNDDEPATAGSLERS